MYAAHPNCSKMGGRKKANKIKLRKMVTTFILTIVEGMVCDDNSFIKPRMARMNYLKMY